MGNVLLAAGASPSVAPRSGAGSDRNAVGAEHVGSGSIAPFLAGCDDSRLTPMTRPAWQG